MNKWAESNAQALSVVADVFTVEGRARLLLSQAGRHRDRRADLAALADARPVADWLRVWWRGDRTTLTPREMPDCLGLVCSFAILAVLGTLPPPKEVAFALAAADFFLNAWKTEERWGRAGRSFVGGQQGVDCLQEATQSLKSLLLDVPPFS